jgi:hypothetical protein
MAIFAREDQLGGELVHHSDRRDTAKS